MPKGDVHKKRWDDRCAYRFPGAHNHLLNPNCRTYFADFGDPEKSCDVL